VLDCRGNKRQKQQQKTPTPIPLSQQLSLSLNCARQGAFFALFPSHLPSENEGKRETTMIPDRAHPKILVFQISFTGALSLHY
jgi:hypothetical protein